MQIKSNEVQENNNPKKVKIKVCLPPREYDLVNLFANDSKTEKSKLGSPDSMLVSQNWSEQ